MGKQKIIIDRDELIDILADVYAKASNRIKDPNSVVEKQNPARKYWTQCKWYEKVLLIINLLLFPFHISKRFYTNDHIHEGLIKVLACVALQLVGGMFWLYGWGSMVYIIKRGRDFMGIIRNSYSIVLGVFFIMTANALAEERDTNKVYAFTACLFAVFSFIITVISNYDKICTLGSALFT